MCIITMGLLLISCSNKNEPAKMESHATLEEETRFPVALYDSFYRDIEKKIFPRIMRFNDVRNYLNDIANGYATPDSLHIAQLTEHYRDSILYLLNTAIIHNNIYIDPNDTIFSTSQVDYMSSLLSHLAHYAYADSHFRRHIYEDVYLSPNQKFTLCVIMAVNNIIYEECYNRTVVIKDTHEYFTMQLPDTILPVQWHLPWDIYEIEVNNIHLFYPNDVYPYMEHNLGQPIAFSSHIDRVYYFDTLNLNHILFYISSEECEERYQQDIDNLEATVAATVLGAGVVNVFVPGTLGATCFSMLIYYGAMKTYYEKKREDCLANAEDEDNH